MLGLIWEKRKIIKNVERDKLEFIKNFCKYEKNISKLLAEMSKSH